MDDILLKIVEKERLALGVCMSPDLEGKWWAIKRDVSVWVGECDGGYAGIGDTPEEAIRLALEKADAQETNKKIRKVWQW